ncbi:unnamed protein product [Bursaphelenchus okinawaensis]|uniref:Uncharacterized protein n=1 Tax=Bursaphelenchus okinawaensis TaxID=465554 RepID=A0A811KPT9_9BILA|nr:unnamed protein product [Bursaphelenchus okinawaensis]CAG9109608.1 unnamed protein product [Bursaphelenchus okinawaensis]
MVKQRRGAPAVLCTISQLNSPCSVGPNRTGSPAEMVHFGLVARAATAPRTVSRIRAPPSLPIPFYSSGIQTVY